MGQINIPARSHKQAMDWSLVLISQGIPSTILEQGEDATWQLEVAEEDYPRAMESINQYLQENRHWAWRREFPVQGFLFDWGALAWVFLILVFYWAGIQSDAFKRAGMMEVLAVSGGEWWRLFTAVWLHGDIAHLAGNATIGLVLLGLAMGLYGTGTGLLAAYLAGIGGNLLVWAIAPGPRWSLGASGLVMGCVGLLAAQPFSAWGTGRHRLRLLMVGIAGGIMLFALLGLGPGTDVMAHFGGFITGIFLGRLCAWLRIKSESSAINLLAGATFAALTLLPWLIAMKRIKS
jgi:rhomboid protease GluP